MMTKRELSREPASERAGQSPAQNTRLDQAAPTRLPIVGPNVLLGLGLGGFFDGIVLHQILQWHHMLTSAGYPATSVGNLEVNTLADGLFHAMTYSFTLAGLLWLWRQARQPERSWSARSLAGGLLLGFGLFNVIEGLIDHLLLGIHHVNETVPPGQWIFWDLGYLLWGAVMLVIGWSLIGASRRELAHAGRSATR